ncbi:MAG: flagellar export chaperone FliS [Pseudomonadota bacterium]
MYPNAFNAYQRSAANTVENNSQILLKLYGGTIRFVRMAKKGIEENRPDIRGEHISKVMAIITELQCALDMEKGGQISRQLDSLYQYAMNRLSVANCRNNTAALDEVEQILITLKEGFEDAARQQQMRKTPVIPIIQEAPRAREEFRCAI